MDGFRFDDLKRGVQIGVYFSPVYLAFSEATDDIEVAFKSEDGRALVAVLERSLASQKHGDSASTDEPLVHRFKNIDGDEDAAFIVRKSPQGLDLTLVSGLEEVDDLSGSDTGGMSVSISSGDARKLTDALSNTLKSLPNDVSAASRAPSM